MHSPKSLTQGLVCVLFTLLFAASLSAENRKKPDFSRLVVVGDSLAAGVENGSLEDVQQEHGFANVIAVQAGASLTLPLVPFPGAPSTLELLNPGGFPPEVEPIPATPLTLADVRENPTQQITDLAVPLQTVADALTLVPTAAATTDETQLATDIVLGFPCPFLAPCHALTQVQQAVTLQPTTLIVDLGNNDILGAVTSGQLGSALSSPATFLAAFDKSYGTMLRTLAKTRATLVVANLPDVTEAPYFILVWKLADAAKIPVLEVSHALGLHPFDYITLDALPAIEGILAGSPGPLPLFCSTTSPTTPCFITRAQAFAVRQVTVAMNEIIARHANAHRAVVVDLFSLIDELRARGYRSNGVTLTTDFEGGLFSLDGLHPTDAGYTIMANRFIETMNHELRTHIPRATIP